MIKSERQYVLVTRHLGRCRCQIEKLTARASTCRQTEFQIEELKCLEIKLTDQLQFYREIRVDSDRLEDLRRLATIADSIKVSRIAAGLSQTELARRIRVNRQLISRYELTDYKTARLSRLQSIARQILLASDSRQ